MDGKGGELKHGMEWTRNTQTEGHDPFCNQQALEACKNGGKISWLWKGSCGCGKGHIVVERDIHGEEGP